ncbi:MAG: DUF4123 domain-containing protein [Acidobacteriota bacterium]
MEKNSDKIKRQLFGIEGAKAYAVLDGASIENLLPMLFKFEPEFVCLFEGDLEPDMAEVAPYLVKLESETPFTNWLIEEGWGNHYGIFAVSFGDFKQVRQHFRKFLIVYDSTGKPMRFRYYDPRVLRKFLPTCTAAELAQLFDKLEFFLLEGEDRKVGIKFRFTNSELRPEKLALSIE